MDRLRKIHHSIVHLLVSSCVAIPTVEFLSELDLLGNARSPTSLCSKMFENVIDNQTEIDDQ
eukprot:2475183-Amphidinium_carterae.1